ncbi:DUF6445 family protein [Cellvibrio sp. UBA7661]|uniref:DUF6445 family protein n=1 Tax=Cellvibrio sp. UBA7661 TaxID=1946311 RepID=UPI002F35A684
MVNDFLDVKILHMGEEKNKVICIDNFLSDPLQLVNFAKASTFTPYAAAAQRKGYPGIRTAAPAELGAALRRKITTIVKNEYEIPNASQIKPLQDALCMMTVPEVELGPLQRIPHFDASSPYFFATLLFLCGEQHGGTGFYRHNATGYEAITPERVEDFLDVSCDELNSKRSERRYFSESNEFFTKIGFVPAAFNRLLVYRGNILHSANIFSDLSLNSDPEVGRLTANIFFSYE